MNDQIDQLLVKAGAYFGGEGVDYSNFDPKEFAELIVRECANHCDLLLDHKISSEWSRGTHDCSRAIKKHFGVEEQEKVAPKPKCSVCGTTENVRYMGGYQPYLCDSVDCIPF